VDIYHHLENTKVYMRPSTGTNVYVIDVLPSGASFSQTFTENTYAQKTLYNQAALVKAGTIKKANPASFSFSVPLLKENDFDTPIFNMLVDLNSENTLKTFDIWFIESTKAFCIEKCIFSAGKFNIEKGSIISLSLEGSGTKLTSADNAGTEIINGASVNFSNVSSSNIPTFAAGNVQARNANRTFLPLNKVLSYRSSTLGLSDDEYTAVAYSQENLLNASLELQNNVDWVKHKTVHGGISSSNRENIEYPSTFSLKDRVLAGNSKWALPTATASEVATNFSNTSAGGGANQHFYENSAWTTGAFSSISNVDYGILFSASSGVNVTTRVSPGPFYTLDMDWRLASNAVSISSLLTYITTSA